MTKYRSPAYYQRQRDKKVEVRQQANATFNHPFPRLTVASERLFQATSEAASLCKFQSSTHAVAWVDSLPPELHAEVILMALPYLLDRCKRRVADGYKSEKAFHKGVVSGRAKNFAKSRTVREKAKLLDRVIEALDTRRVGEKPLGDCTRTDLLREAYRLDEIASEATLDAALYRQLAEIIGDQTVRAYSGRGQVVALLTSRWGEEREAA